MVNLSLGVVQSTESKRSNVSMIIVNGFIV